MKLKYDIYISKKDKKALEESLEKRWLPILEACKKGKWEEAKRLEVETSCSLCLLYPSDMGCKKCSIYESTGLECCGGGDFYDNAIDGLYRRKIKPIKKMVLFLQTLAKQPLLKRGVKK